MAKIYRIMLSVNDLPQVGCNANMLGVRVSLADSSPVIVDIISDPDHNVHPDSGGLSVNNCPCSIPPTVAPRRLNQVILGAKRPNSDGRRLWSRGSGDFVKDKLSDQLVLNPVDNEDLNAHQKGYVEPAEIMQASEFQTAISNTQGEWVIDEKLNVECKICRQKNVSI